MTMERGWMRGKGKGREGEVFKLAKSSRKDVQIQIERLFRLGTFYHQKFNAVSL